MHGTSYDRDTEGENIPVTPFSGQSLCRTGDAPQGEQRRHDRAGVAVETEDVLPGAGHRWTAEVTAVTKETRMAMDIASGGSIVDRGTFVLSRNSTGSLGI